MSKYLLLPQEDEQGVPYLSYSQISKWKKSKREYIRKYFFGEDSDSDTLQIYGDFGHKVGEAFENNDYSAFEPDEIEFLKTVPKFDEFEREVKLQLDGFYLKGYIDTSTKPQVDKEDSIPFRWVKKIADYKTGDIEKKGSSIVDYSSNDYNQVEIYAAALRQEFGKAPIYGAVYLIGRSGNAFKGEDLKLTKEFITIERKLNDKTLDKVVKEIQEIGEEISNYYQAFLKLNQLI